MRIKEEIVTRRYADNGYWLPPDETRPLIRCRHCEYFETKDWWYDLDGVPILAASECPTCNKWGGGGCKTDPDGFCFLAKPKTTK